MSLERDLAVAFVESHPTEAAVAFERMRPELRAAALEALPVDAAVHAIREMVAPTAAECLAQIHPDTAAAIVDALDVDASAPVLRRISREARARLLAALPVRTRETIDRVLQYPDGTAGAVMDPNVPALPDDVSVGDARVRLRRTGLELLFYIYIVDREQRLVGVLDLPELMSARASDPVSGVMHGRVDRLAAWTPASAVRLHPGWRSYHAMPVVDESGRFLGAIRYQTLRRLEQEADTASAQRPTAATVAALGELFHLGVAGFVEGLSAAAVPRGRSAPITDAARMPEARDE